MEHQHENPIDRLMETVTTAAEMFADAKEIGVHIENEVRKLKNLSQYMDTVILDAVKLTIDAVEEYKAAIPAFDEKDPAND